MPGIRDLKGRPIDTDEPGRPLIDGPVRVRPIPDDDAVPLNPPSNRLSLAEHVPADVTAMLSALEAQLALAASHMSTARMVMEDIRLRVALDADKLAEITRIKDALSKL